MSQNTKAGKLIKRASCNPFSDGCYGKIWDVLFYYRAHGISMESLVLQVQKQLKLKNCPKPLQNILWDCGVVLSAKPDRLSHRSVRKASDHYEIIGNGLMYRLVVKDHSEDQRNLSTCH